MLEGVRVEHEIEVPVAVWEVVDVDLRVLRQRVGREGPQELRQLAGGVDLEDSQERVASDENGPRKPRWRRTAYASAMDRIPAPHVVQWKPCWRLM